MAICLSAWAKNALVTYWTEKRGSSFRPRATDHGPGERIGVGAAGRVAAAAAHDEVIGATRGDPGLPMVVCAATVAAPTAIT